MSIHSYPEYLNEGVIYQINLRAFTPEGTLNAAAKLLPHIKGIGADIVYLCPCFGADADEDIAGWSDRQRASKLNNPQNPYRISDYYNVDPEYGANDDLKAFVAAAHELDLKVILDLVYFHCGPSAVFLDEHPDFIVRDAEGKPDVGQWRFPKLNFASEGLREYLTRNMELFVRDFGVDGYRCDVGDGVPLDFWAQAKARIDAIRPGLMMLNEGSKPDYIDVFDLNYGWFFCSEFRACVEEGKPASSFVESHMSYSQNHLQGSFNSVAMLENHDFVNDDYDHRLESRIGHAAMDLGFALNYTLPNVPFIYNGTEVADTNRHSIWGNRFHGANLVIDWQNALTKPGAERLKLIRTLSALRHTMPVLGMKGSLAFASASDEHILAYKRELEGDRIAVIANLSGEEVSAVTELTSFEIDPIMLRGATVSLNGPEGKLAAILKPYGFAIIEF